MNEFDQSHLQKVQASAEEQVREQHPRPKTLGNRVLPTLEVGGLLILKMNYSLVGQRQECRSFMKINEPLLKVVTRRGVTW